VCSLIKLKDVSERLAASFFRVSGKPACRKGTVDTGTRQVYGTTNSKEGTYAPEYTASYTRTKYLHNNSSGNVKFVRYLAV
jgi:hypothetical protein